MKLALFSFLLALFIPWFGWCQTPDFKMRVRKPIIQDQERFVYKGGTTREFIMTKKELIAEGGLIAGGIMDPGENLTITSFDVTEKLGSNLKTAPSNGNKFTNTQVQLINEATYGKTIFIENIKTLEPGETIKLLPSIRINLVKSK